MHVTTALAILLVLQCSELCVSIKVPIVWNDRENSEVKPNSFNDEEFSVEIFKPSTIQQVPVPIEYFQYSAKKPQFAIDVATFHDVPSPASHYKAYPVRPYTGKEKPILGQHRLEDQKREIYVPLQKYIKNKDHYNSHATPIISNYEVYHPYKAEVPALQEIYKDPVLDKIRNDLRDTSKRLQNYENEAGKSDIKKEDYNESFDETDRKKVPEQNVPTQYEVHHPQRRPAYYRPLPKLYNREQILNKKFRHPWNQNYVKIRPVHYQPLKENLQKLKQQHALTYDDERNEYPQVPAEEIEDTPEGYDIYEKGKDKYVQLRNNVDESINQAVRDNHPAVTHNLEFQNEDKSEDDDDDEEEEFVPVKSYAQVRKSETTKHLPREAALEDADTYEEIRNAPRLKEAVKTSKAQTIYTEEGYEDSAYDHAGEQKHASDHEGHGGYLKENEISGGKYKIPSLDTGYDNNRGTAYRDQLLHGKKWINSDKDVNEETELEKYSDSERDHSVESNIKNDNHGYDEDDRQRNKRENQVPKSIHDKIGDITENKHDYNKREDNFKVPEIDFDTTYLTEAEILEIAKEKIVDNAELKSKYPYYFKNLTTVHKDSPLRYAENLKFIPKKSEGGTEFYDSRSNFECPEVDDKLDALSKKLKEKDNPDNQHDEESKEVENDPTEDQPRLKSLGNKIDCFKTKYFGEDPLDSPFFKEDIIANPEPVTVPNILTFKIAQPKEISAPKSNNISNIVDGTAKGFNEQNEIINLIEKLRNGQNELNASVKRTNLELLSTQQSLGNISYDNSSKISQPSDTFKKIKADFKATESRHSLPYPIADADNNKNVTYNYYNNKEDITKLPPVVRKKRGAPFVYEPYKIIKDGQVQDSKKTTTTGNISPLIKQLQSSRVADKVSKSDSDKQQEQQKRSTNPKTYKDIGKNDRSQIKSSNDNNDEVKFIDINLDKRRGEPRYELRSLNHKPEYSTVENKKSMSKEEYENQTKQEKYLDNKLTKNNPVLLDVHDSAASNTVQRTVSSTISPTKNIHIHAQKDSAPDIEEDYNEDYEYDDDDEELEVTTLRTTTTTTNTPKPIFRKRTKTTTTEKPEKENETEIPKLRLVTKFRTTPSVESKEEHSNVKLIKNKDNEDKNVPKYKEKKKKSTKRTLVTDTKRYGEDENDDTKKEVDALIGIKHDMEDYMPNYEKEELRRDKDNGSIEFSDEDEDDESNEDEEDDDDENEDADDENSDIDDDIDDDTKLQDPLVTTPEPTKRTLLRTTDTPIPTTEAINAKSVLKPIISKKKIEIHKELPANKSSPHVTQFKEDIEEVEIIKELPTKLAKKPQKDREVLELYKDENLAKEVNKLKDVEVFKENLDLVNGPKHGGNYRNAKLIEASTIKALHGGNLKAENKDNIYELEIDAEASQSENKKSVELDSHYKPGGRMHGGNLKSINDFKSSRRSIGRNAKLTELMETTEHVPRARHGGNLKSVQDTSRWRGNRKSQRLTELGDHDERNDDDSSGSSYGTSSKSYGSGRQSGRPMHGGNYRSAKLIQADASIELAPKPQRKLPKTRERTSKEAKNKAAVLLNSFAQAVPILTTTPAYILDPSKRMYYYVEA